MSLYVKSKFEASTQLVLKIQKEYAGRGLFGGVGWADAWRDHPEWVREVFGTAKPPARHSKDHQTFQSFARRTRLRNPEVAKPAPAQLPVEAPPQVLPPQWKRGPQPHRFREHRDLILEMKQRYLDPDTRQVQWKLAFQENPQLKAILNDAEGRTISRFYAYASSLTLKRKYKKREPISAPVVTNHVPTAPIPVVPTLKFCPDCGFDLRTINVALGLASRYEKTPRH